MTMKRRRHCDHVGAIAPVAFALGQLALVGLAWWLLQPACSQQHLPLPPPHQRRRGPAFPDAGERLLRLSYFQQQRLETAIHSWRRAYLPPRGVGEESVGEAKPGRILLPVPFIIHPALLSRKRIPCQTRQQAFHTYGRWPASCRVRERWRCIGRPAMVAPYLPLYCFLTRLVVM